MNLGRSKELILELCAKHIFSREERLLPKMKLLTKKLALFILVIKINLYKKMIFKVFVRNRLIWAV